MRFPIRIENRGRWLHLTVELVDVDTHMEEYKVSIGDRFILLRNNAPILRKKKLTHWTPEWKLYEGVMKTPGALDRIIEQITRYLGDFNKSAPIKFIHKGKTTIAVLSRVSGAGANSWHLLINNFFCGSVEETERGWVFHPGNNSEDLKEHGHLFIKAAGGR